VLRLNGYSTAQFGKCHEVPMWQTNPVEFDYTEAGTLGGPAAVTLYVDGEQAAAGPLARTTPLVFSYDETTDVGRDSGSAVSADYGAAGNEFTGTINWVQLEKGQADNRHVVSPEDRWRVAMARQ
jgi:arylsulfatase A-like enzyme